MPPSQPRLQHLALSVTDLDASMQWYETVFDIHFLKDTPVSGGVGKILADSDRRLIIALHQYDTNDGQPAVGTVAGLDHAGFIVPTRGDLEAWQRHLEAHGVIRMPTSDSPLTQSAITEDSFGSVLVFRDPDNIQFEFFCNLFISVYYC